MANLQFAYTASPLGLVTSFSEFNYGTSSNGGIQSIFTSYQSPKQKMILKTNHGRFNAVLSGTPHSDEVYDMSTTNIIEKLKDINQLKLNFADFAYLRDFGVYPNNRLIVARRFPQPVVDDLYSINTSTSPINSPLSTVIGYNKEQDDFIKLTFNEEWEGAEVSFKNLLNDVGGDFGMKGKFQLGNILEAGVNILPLPGASLLLQRQIMKSLGIISDVDPAIIPQGDPNIIKEARVRTLIGEDSGGGSGLTCKVSIKLTTVYEQKFINGVDPTIVFMDILNNALNMGTSPATFYLGKQNDATNSVSKTINSFLSNPDEAIKTFIEKIITAISSQLDTLNTQMKNDAQNTSSTPPGQGANDILSLLRDVTGEPQKDSKGNVVKGVSTYVKDFIKHKYKVKFLGIISALTGAASTPWHVTIGNPLRPIFCSGDMLCKGVDVNFGPQLSFNDLPTYIEVTVNLESARNLGLQEIFSKFNSGGIRLLTGTSSSVGDYIAGMAQSFWNNEQSYGTSSNATIPNKSSQSPQSSDGLTKTTNNASATQSNLTKVNIPSITPVSLSSISNTTPSLTSDQEISPDPYATSPTVSAGSNSGADALRRQTTQDVVGSKEGYSDQLIGPVNTPNSGQGATPINATGALSSPTSTNWPIGQSVASGSLSYTNGNTYNYTVTNGQTHGLFESNVNGSDGTSYTFQGTSEKNAINNMQTTLFKINNTTT